MMVATRSAAPLALELPRSMIDRFEANRLSSDVPLQRTGCTIGICACHPGAGATTVAQNLAVMMHEREGDPVVLVEGNLRSPSLGVRSRVYSEPGFTGFALGEEIASTIVEDAVQQGVSLMVAAGDRTPLPLLRRAAARLPALREKYTHVLVDLPPVLDFPDTPLMGAALDGVVLVLEAESTRWEDARRAKKRLEASGVQLLGAVLNKKPRIIPDWLARLL